MSEEQLANASSEVFPPKFTEIAIQNSFELHMIDAETRDELIKACRGLNYDEFIHIVDDKDEGRRRARLGKLIEEAYAKTL
jgi:hypothetical protein